MLFGHVCRNEHGNCFSNACVIPYSTSLSSSPSNQERIVVPHDSTQGMFYDLSPCTRINNNNNNNNNSKSYIMCFQLVQLAADLGARTSETITSKEVENCALVLEQLHSSKLTAEDVRDKLLQKGTERVVGFDLPKLVLTMQTQFRSSNTNVTNFKKYIGTAQRNFFSREPTLDISAEAQAEKVNLVAVVGAKAQFASTSQHSPNS